MTRPPTIQFAGSRNNASEQLIDIPSLPNGATIPAWQPETTKDDFWGTDWSDWKPPPPPHMPATNMRLPPGASLLDAPIETDGNAAGASDAALADQLQRTSIDGGEYERDSNAETYSQSAYTPSTLRTKSPEKRLPHELTAILLRPTARYTRGTVDRIFARLANPPRRRRFVRDEDWEHMSDEGLGEAIGRHLKLVRYLVRENKKLIKQCEEANTIEAESGGNGVEAIVWREDEHLAVVQMTELSREGIKSIGRARLRGALMTVQIAREDLLDMNDEMSLQIEELRKR